MNTKPIEELIIQSEENLRIAEAVVDALPAVRHRLAEDFLARLDARVKKAFPGWKSEHSGTYFSDRYVNYSFWKPIWEDDYGLTLQFGDYGQKMNFGIYRETEKVGDRPYSDELLSAARAAFPQAQTNPWREAWIPMETPAEDWRKIEILWRMHKDDSFLDDVAEQLLELARIGEPIVDQLVKRYQK